MVGSGGREHAIVRALGRSPQQPDLIAAPGNPGIEADADVFDVAADDVAGLVSLARAQAVDLVVVGPEVPLVAGLVDALEAVGIAAFGPTAAAAALEGSKARAKQVMDKAGVPTAAWSVVRTVEEGMAAITSYPVVLKDDGLAAGKGVVIALDAATALATLTDFLVDGRFGHDDPRVVVEEFLEGEEVSLLALCDGERAYPLAPAQDYKRIFDGDEGPNTGGMGSYSPVVGVDAAAVTDLVALVHQPIVDALAAEGTPFHGVLYAGIMLTATGPKVLEYNVRFGDPETQAVLPRLRSDLLALLLAAMVPGGLADIEITFDDGWAVTLVLASGGYPESASKGDVIAGLHAMPAGIELTHAGTSRRGAELITAGGRVLNVTALGTTAATARDAAYAAADKITFEGRQLRRDIAQRAVERSS